MNSRLRDCCAVAMALLCGAAAGHPLAPALLQLTEHEGGAYAVLWRTSVSRSQRLDVTPILPAACRATGPADTATEGGDAVVSRWRVQCAASGLAGGDITVQGLAQSGINVIVKLIPRKGEQVQTLLGPDRTRFTVPDVTQSPPVFASYLRWGVEHLFGGLDHLLFIFGLWLLVRGGRALFFTITAFTLGHSLTLGLAVLNVIHVPQALAELGIAISILLLAQQVIAVRTEHASQNAARSAVMAAAFGLLHGLGFAAALTEVGLPQGEVVTALLGFNIGIELGQLLLVAALAVISVLAGRLAVLNGPQWQRFAAYGMGSLAGFWCIERGLGLIGVA